MSVVEKRFTIALDIKAPLPNPDIEVVDDDNGNVIEVSLTDNGRPIDLTDCRVVVIFANPNGVPAQQDTDEGHGVTLLDETGKFEIELFTTSFSPGVVNAEVQVLSGETFGTLVTSAQFNFKCRRGIANEETVQSTKEWPLLTGLIRRVEGMEDKLDELVPQAEETIDRSNAAAEQAQEAVQNADEKADDAATAAQAATEAAGKANAAADTAGEAGRAAAAAADRANEAAEAAENIVAGALPKHADTHAADGSDPVTPSMIGAVSKEEAAPRDLSKIMTPEELHERISKRHCEGINIGDYWPIMLSGEFSDFAVSPGESPTKKQINALVILEFMPNFYYGCGETGLANGIVPEHVLACSRNCIPVQMNVREDGNVWSETGASNPMTGSAIYKTLNDPDHGIVRLFENTPIGHYLYKGPNGKGMRFHDEAKSSGATAATGSVWVDRGRLFLPTEREVWGQPFYSEPSGGDGGALQWPIFAGGRKNIMKRIGEGGGSVGWWCSSSAAGSATNFCLVRANAYADKVVASYSTRYFSAPICCLIV